MSSRRCNVAVPGATLEVWIAEPQPGSEHQVLLIHENRGMVPYMVMVTEELAAAGYRVVAPDLLSRLGGTDKFADDPTAVSTRQIEAKTHVADLLTVYDQMVEAGSIPAIFGLCFGGEMGWQLITHRRPRGAVLFYGIGPTPEAAAAIDCPVFAVYAEDDPRVNATLDSLTAALAGASGPFILESYPGTRHAFHDRTRPERFNARAAEVAWRHALDFLEDLFDTS